MIRLEEGFSEERPHMPAPESIDHATSVPRGVDKAGEAQLREVLTGHRRSALGDGGKGGYVQVPISKRPEHPQPGRLGQEREGHHRRVDLFAGKRVRMRWGNGLG